MIVRNFLSLEEFRSQDTSGAVVLSIAKFHENEAKKVDEGKEFSRKREVIQDHIGVAKILREIGYKLDPSLKVYADLRRAERQAKRGY